MTTSTKPERGLRAATGDLVLEGVTKRFTDFVAVDDLSLTVPRGSFYALLGPSGCGKTTTLRMVAGLEQPTSGRILIGGTDLTGSRPWSAVKSPSRFTPMACMATPTVSRNSFSTPVHFMNACSVGFFLVSSSKSR